MHDKIVPSNWKPRFGNCASRSSVTSLITPQHHYAVLRGFVLESDKEPDMTKALCPLFARLGENYYVARDRRARHRTE